MQLYRSSVYFVLGVMPNALNHATPGCDLHEGLHSYGDERGRKFLPFDSILLVPRLPRLIDVGNDGGDGDFQYIRHFFIGGLAHADGVWHVHADALFGDLREFTNEVEFIHEFREAGLQDLEVPMGHREDMGGFFQKCGGNRLAFEFVKIGSAFLQDRYCLAAGGGAFGGGHACRTHFVIAAIRDRLEEQPLRHGAAAGISSANKQHTLHLGHRAELGGPDGIRQIAIAAGLPNGGG